MSYIAFCDKQSCGIGPNNSRTELLVTLLGHFYSYEYLGIYIAYSVLYRTLFLAKVLVYKYWIKGYLYDWILLYPHLKRNSVQIHQCFYFNYILYSLYKVRGD